jgi:hypothetical protein
MNKKLLLTIFTLSLLFSAGVALSATEDQTEPTPTPTPTSPPPSRPWEEAVDRIE